MASNPCCIIGCRVRCWSSGEWRYTPPEGEERSDVISKVRRYLDGIRVKKCESDLERGWYPDNSIQLCYKKEGLGQKSNGWRT
jgi:hypothetical protein